MPKRGQKSKSKKGVRRGGRKLQPAVAGLYANALAGAAAARVANTFTGLRGRGRPRGSRNQPVVQAIKRANSEGYISPVSQVIGNAKTNLSFREKVHKIMNPPQTLLYQTQGRLDATSGRQSVLGYTVGNSMFSDFFAYMAAGKSDNSAASAGTVDTTAVTNSVTHLYTSIQHTFMNSSNLAAELDIYIFKAVQDIGSADQAASASGAWSYAEQINTLNTVAADGTDRIGKKPTDLSARYYLNRYWKLLGKTSVTMKPGESFKHYFRQHLNKSYVRYMLSQDTTGVTREHSISFIYVTRGQVVGSSLTADVSTGDAQISLTRSTKMSFCYAQNVRPRDYVVGTDFVQIAAANQIFMNTDSSTQNTGYVEDA